MIDFDAQVDPVKKTYWGVRVPLAGKHGDSPEQVVAEADRSLTYDGWHTYTGSNALFRVRDSDGTKILKLASAPARATQGFTHKEHNLLKMLNAASVQGVPHVFKFYNSPANGEVYNKEALTGMLREYVVGEGFNDQLRSSHHYQQLKGLVSDMAEITGYGLPSDFRQDQLIVDATDRPILLDLEEARKANYARDARRIDELKVENVEAHLKRKLGKRFNHVTEWLSDRGVTVLDKSVVLVAKAMLGTGMIGSNQ